MTKPRFERTDELHEALENFAQRRTDLVIAGVDLERIGEFVDAVRRVDAELIAAHHVYRNKQQSPYYPTEYQAEEDGLEAAEALLRSDMPEQGDNSS